MFTNHLDNLLDCRPRRRSLSIEESPQFTKEPRISQAAPANHDTGNPGPAHTLQPVFGLEDITIAKHLDLDLVVQHRDELPIGLSRVHLLHRAAVHGDP